MFIDRGRKAEFHRNGSGIAMRWSVASGVAAAPRPASGCMLSPALVVPAAVDRPALCFGSRSAGTNRPFPLTPTESILPAESDVNKLER